MHLDDYTRKVREQLLAAAALGDERTQHIANTLATTIDSAVRLAVLEAVTDTCTEVSHALGDTLGTAEPSVTTHLDGDDVRIAVTLPRHEHTEAPRPDDGDASARISLRLSEALKADIERAASAADLSVNTWLVRAAATALRSGPGAPPTSDWRTGIHPRVSNRITGWVTG